MNYFYENEITEEIKNIISHTLDENEAKNITEGNFMTLPTIDGLDGLLPAVMVDLVNINNQFANEAFDILYSVYSYSILYVYPYSYQNNDINTIKRAKEVANKILNILITNGLKGFKLMPLEDDKNDKGGYVVNSIVKNIDYQSPVNDFLAEAGVELSVITIDFEVGFRTYERRKRNESDI